MRRNVEESKKQEAKVREGKKRKENKYTDGKNEGSALARRERGKEEEWKKKLRKERGGGKEKSKREETRKRKSKQKNENERKKKGSWEEGGGREGRGEMRGEREGRKGRPTIERRSWLYGRGMKGGRAKESCLFPSLALPSSSLSSPLHPNSPFLLFTPFRHHLHHSLPKFPFLSIPFTRFNGSSLSSPSLSPSLLFQSCNSSLAPFIPSLSTSLPIRLNLIAIRYYKSQHSYSLPILPYLFPVTFLITNYSASFPLCSYPFFFPSYRSCEPHSFHIPSPLLPTRSVLSVTSRS